MRGKCPGSQRNYWSTTMSRILKGCGIGCGVVALLAAGAGGYVYLTYVKPLQTPAPPAPQVGKSVALRPTIVRRSGEPFEAGTAVAVRLQPKAKPIVLTALHLFGPMGGMERDLSPPELKTEVRMVLLTPLGARQPTGVGSGALRKTGTALAEDNKDLSLDFAAFTLSSKSRVNALDLATELPKNGEWLWLVGDEVAHEPQTQRLFPAQVIVASNNEMVVRFKERFELQAFS